MVDRSQEEDEALRAGWMAAAQRGDRESYESLLASLLPPLRAFVGRRGVDGSAIEDVVQEILLLLHRARHTWRPERPFHPWLWAIARNATTDALRRQTRERGRRAAPAEPDDERGLALVDGPNPPSDPERDAMRRELGPRLAAALQKLPAAQRQAVELLYLEQLSVAEAADRAGVTPTALKVRAHRGSRALREILGGEELR